jgi:hypothetical protein
VGDGPHERDTRDNSRVIRRRNGIERHTRASRVNRATGDPAARLFTRCVSGLRARPVPTAHRR